MVGWMDGQMDGWVEPELRSSNEVSAWDNNEQNILICV